ncbi:MAG: terminase family protein, partial [Clostridia bacterium]|nr:terminase family protein [Clostridia bacterium]
KGFPENGIIDHIVIKNVFGGKSTIGFKSLDQGREKFQGASLDFVWFDEEPDKDVYDECVMRVLDREGDVWCTMTPLKGLTWVYDDIYMSNNPDVWYTTMDWSDNPYLNPKETKKLESMMSKEELETRKSGKFKAQSGLVYPEFDESVHVVDPITIPPEWYDTISIDPGLHNPLSAHFYAIDYDGNVYVIAEHYEAEKDVDYHAEKIKKIANSLGWPRDSKGRLHALIDSAAEQRTLSSQKSVADLFYERDILVNTKVNKDLWSGIARVRSLFLQRPARIFIFKNCVNLINEIKAYRYDVGEKPKKTMDHALDELRYYVMSKPKSPEKDKPSESLIARDKRLLIRKLRSR